MGRPLPPLAALDDSGRVVHLSSFSKSLFPGIRIGAVAARGRAIEGLVALKHSTDLSDSMPLQAALAEFIAAGEYDRHLKRLRGELRVRREALLDALDRHMPEGAWWTRPEGGYQCWLELPLEVDTRDLLADAARAGVLFAPGSQFLPEGGASRAMRLVIAQANAEEIERGIEALGRVVEARQRVGATALQSASVQL
jgi:DNA-binding transcriptional MocR family regulator